MDSHDQNGEYQCPQPWLPAGKRSPLRCPTRSAGALGQSWEILVLNTVDIWLIYG